ncbi:MAG TPA: PD-(D/E)XK nuclease family protein [Blastocatellia bacterium]|nr:PD-(D/E)XK nuclease family protein [Blastocatellia bacterium]
MHPSPQRRLLMSSDAATRLDAAAEWLSAHPRDAEILVLSSTREAGDDLLRTAALASGARFGLTRLTLDMLAARLAAPVLASNGGAPVSGLSLVALAARAVHLLLTEGTLSYFGPVAAKPGFPSAIARTIEELRMNGVNADAIRRLPRGGPDLAALAERMDGELASARLADRAGVFEAAIEVARGELAPHPVGWPLLVLDLPMTTAREREFVDALIDRSPDAMATAPRGDRASIDALERALACQASEATVSEIGSLAALKAHVFEDHAPPRAALDSTVTLTSWPGESRECVEIARFIQREAASGVAFDRIAVFLRSPAEYGPHLEEAFRRAAIPVYFARGTSRPDAAGRALLALLSCRSEGLSARRFAEYLSLAQVPDPSDADASRADEHWTPPQSDLLPTALEAVSGAEATVEAELPGFEVDGKSIIGGTVRAPWRWERLLVESAVIGSEERWERRIAGLDHELRLRRDELGDEDESRAALLDRDIRDLTHLGEFALPLIKKLAALPDSATWGEWLAHLREFALTALRDPVLVIETLIELAPMSPVGPVELFEVQRVLAPRLSDLGVRPPRRRYGHVFVGPTDAARGMSFDVVFVPGLAERLFPRKVVEDPILLDAERRQLGDVELVTQRDRVAAERLALRLALGAAAKRVYLSYPRIDVQQSRPRVPSFYGLEALRAAEGELPGFDELGTRAESGSSGRLGWPAPESARDAIDEAEYDLALLGPLVDADPETTAGTAHYLLESNPHLARALRARSRRWLRRWTSYDGLVEPDESALEALAQHRLSARSFSPTALQNFAACPYRFFLQAVHRLQPREEPAALEVIDPLTRGSLFHKVQYEVLTLLRDEGRLPVTPQNVEPAIEDVDRVLDRVAARYEDELWPAIPKVWEDGINSIRADLREWLRRHASADDGWVPYKFELSFGLADRDREDEDPSSVADPVQIVSDLKVRGSIDLVERHATGKLRATDHKTGKARAKEGVVIGGGQHLQPVLYALACEKLLDGGVDSGRLYYCTADGGYEERVVMLDKYARGYAGIMVETVGGALEEGFLPAAPDHDACVWCDYLAVCGPHEERRVRVKPQERLIKLKELRTLP